MTQQEYKQKKMECWHHLAFNYHRLGDIPKAAFDYIFDRAYALGKQEKDGIDLKKLNEMLDDTLKKETKESLNQWLSEKNADTVIQGWVARNGSGPNDLGLHVYSIKPDRMKNRREWNGHGEMSYLIDCRLFTDLTWDDEPIEVEIIIKRKKNGH